MIHQASYRMLSGTDVLQSVHLQTEKIEDIRTKTTATDATRGARDFCWLLKSDSTREV